MAEHATRDHAVWSASSTARNWACSGALALTMDLPETTNEAADWGTACHQLSEKCLRDGTQAIDYLGSIEKGKKHEFEVDDEMAETAQEYVDFVRHAAAMAAPTGVNPATLLHIEQRFSLGSLNPPFDAGGTADAVIWAPESRTLHVVDLKGGRGVVVEATGNPQLRTYALGAMLANPQWKPSRIKVTIVQPRAPHKDGRIRSEEFHVADLLEWTVDLVGRMEAANEAWQYHKHRDVNDLWEMTPVQWNTTFLAAGDHCKFCKAAGFCPALEQTALDAAGVWFDDQDAPRLANTPDVTDPDERKKRLDLLPLIEDWINAVRRYEHDLAESGQPATDYMLVEKIGNRAWKADVTPDAVAALLAAANKDPGAAYAPAKPASPAQVEKALGAKEKGRLAELIERPLRGTTLVSAEKTTKPAATPKAQQHFDILD